jgi:hypothetical protein
MAYGLLFAIPKVKRLRYYRIEMLMLRLDPPRAIST